jgi:putative membrane protein
MQILSKILVVIVALLHTWFLILEMFLWQHSLGLKTFGNTAEMASQTAVLAANQGLYNGFLAVGLIFGMFHSDKKTSKSMVLFFLICIIVAGVYGSITAKPSILYIQALPAALALLAVWFSEE